MQKILIPTDGSELSDRAIPLAEAVCRAQGAEALVIQVVEPLRLLYGGDYDGGYMAAETYDDIVAAIEADARANLDRVAAHFTTAGVANRTFLLHGGAALELLDLEAREQADLVIIATHGRTGVTRFALGSIADRVVREGTAPVLLVPAQGEIASSFQRALLPLDGSEVAEAALPVAEALAGKPLRSVQLLRAVRPDDDQNAALLYLDWTAKRLREAGLTVETATKVERPAAAISAGADSVDLVILATHGRGGLARMRHGSVAEQVTQQMNKPILLVRAKSNAAADVQTAAGAAGGVR